MDFARIKAYDMGTKYFERPTDVEKKGEYIKQYLANNNISFTSKEPQQIGSFQPLLSGNISFNMTMSRPDGDFVGATMVVKIYQGDKIISEIEQGMAGTVINKQITMSFEVEALKTYKIMAYLSSGDERILSYIYIDGRVCTKPSNYIVVR